MCPVNLSAVNRRGGVAAETMTIRSSGAAVAVRIQIEESSGDVAYRYRYATIGLVDNLGSVVPFDDRVITIEAIGGIQLMGYGSARPSTTDDQLGTACGTSLGRAQAILRTEVGVTGELIAHAAGLTAARLTI
jgi:beta-galactosidase